MQLSHTFPKNNMNLSTFAVGANVSDPAITVIKSIWRPGTGNIPCYSCEHYQLQRGNIYAIARYFPAIAGYCTRFVFSCNCWYFSQVQPGHCPRFNLGIVPAFYGVGENSSCQNLWVIKVSIVQWLRCLLATSEGLGLISAVMFIYK